MIRSDHVLHFGWCYFISSLATIPWWIWHQRWMGWIPVVLGLVAGFYKEFKDIRTTGFDWTDILADVAGIATAMLLWGLAMIGG